VPGSLLGMLLIYGLVGKLVGLDLVVLLTPFLAVISGIYFYKLASRIFGVKIGFLSAILFFINPAWWYYASFFMLPNVSFICFLIIGFYYLSRLDKFKKQNNVLFLILGALGIFLALAIRANEFFWILPLLIILLVFYSKKINWYYVLIFLVVGFLVFLPIFYYDHEAFGSFLSFGYLRLGQGTDFLSQLPTEFKVSNDIIILNFAKLLFLPFGFNPKLAFINFCKYYVVLFWWLFLAAVLGFVSFYRRGLDKEKKVYTLCAIFASLYLAIYYGSWLFEDQLTLALNKIGISYVRYFLPIYIFSLPFAAVFFLDFINFFQNKKIRILLSSFLIVAFLTLTLNVVFLAGNDNLLKVKENIKTYTEIDKKVVSLTEDNAVIISQRGDKIFFPERKVAVANLSEIKNWAKLINNKTPLYYFAYESDDYIANLNSELGKNGLELFDKTQISSKEYLYKIGLKK
jgi:hypothetical protein